MGRNLLVAVNKYWVGNKIWLRAEFKDQAGILTDPTSIALVVKNPLGVKVTVVPVHQTVGGNAQIGKYEYQYEITAAGEHLYWFTAVKGVDKAVIRNTFISNALE